MDIVRNVRAQRFVSLSRDENINYYITIKSTADDNSTETNAALDWLKAGGRGIDTAYDYHNQDQVGAAIRESGIERKNIFVTTKISPTICTF